MYSTGLLPWLYSQKHSRPADLRPGPTEGGAAQNPLKFPGNTTSYLWAAVQSKLMITGPTWVVHLKHMHLTASITPKRSIYYKIGGNVAPGVMPDLKQSPLRVQSLL